MFTDPFTKCPPDLVEKLLLTLDLLKPDHGFHKAGLSVLRKDLGFYPGTTFFDITQADVHPDRSLQLVVGKEQALILDGDITRLMTFNQAYPIKLDRHLVLDYARFYFAHIPGPHGKTLIIDTVDDLPLREEPTPSLRSSLGDKIIPLSLNGSLGEGGYQVRGSVLIRHALYSTVLDIDSKGNITAEPGRVLADTLPLHDRVLEF